MMHDLRATFRRLSSILRKYLLSSTLTSSQIRNSDLPCINPSAQVLRTNFRNSIAFSLLMTYSNSSPKCRGDFAVLFTASKINCSPPIFRKPIWPNSLSAAHFKILKTSSFFTNLPRRFLARFQSIRNTIRDAREGQINF